MIKKFNRHYLIFLGHGILLAITMAMIDFNTVFPALIDKLSDSKIIFGALYSIMLGVPFVFNLLFSHIMRRSSYKKKYLVLGISLRAISFLGIALFVYFFALNNTSFVVYSLFFWIFIFSLSGGFAGIAYLDIIGKVFTREQRGNFFTYKQFASSLSALIGGFVIKKIFDLKGLEFPINYTLILLIAFAGLFLAIILFGFIKEPPSKTQGEGQNIVEFLKEIPDILKKDKVFTQFIVIQNLTSFSLMIIPFYMIYARETFNVTDKIIGDYLLFQISGTIISNFFWGIINKKWGNKSIVYLCILLGAITPLLAIGVSYLGASYYYIIFFIVGFLISGRKIGFDPYLLEISPEDYRTTYIGINGTLSLFIIISPLLGGIIIEAIGLTKTFILVSLVMLITSFLFINKRSDISQGKEINNYGN